MPGKPNRTRVYIVRHGQSTFNVQHRYQGRSDEPVLTETGVQSAVQTGRYLVDESIDGIITSPLRRARRTAHIIAATLREGGRRHSSLKVCDDLMEIHLPEWEGAEFERIRQQFPHSHRLWSDEPQDFRMLLDGSTFFPVRELFEQAKRFWREFLEHHAGQSIALVTHGGTARALICTPLGLGPEIFHSLQQSNCGISILEFPAGSATADVEALNLTTHLGERMPKLKLGRRGTRIVLIASNRAEQAAHASGMGVAERSVNTIVRVSRQPDLDRILSSILGLTRSPWKNCTNAVLHYPVPGKKPVIQAFNSLLWKGASEPALAETGP